MQGNAFARSKLMFAAIAAAMALGGAAQRSAMSGIGPYQSRGKGRGKTPPSNHCVAMDRRGVRKPHEPKVSRSKYIPHFGAKQREKLAGAWLNAA